MNIEKPKGYIIELSSAELDKRIYKQSESIYLREFILGKPQFENAITTACIFRYIMEAVNSFNALKEQLKDHKVNIQIIEI